MNRTERRARAHKKPRLWQVSRTVNLQVKAATQQEAIEKANNTPLSEWNTGDLEPDVERVHTEDCMDANDDTSVLKGECICE